MDAAVAAVFGLHGLPLPKYAPLVSYSDDPSQPVAVTPDVIATTYKVSGVTPKGGLTNRMAVAEFQGQNEEDADLAKFFKTYVKNAQPGERSVCVEVAVGTGSDAGGLGVPVGVSEWYRSAVFVARSPA